MYFFRAVYLLLLVVVFQLNSYVPCTVAFVNVENANMDSSLFQNEPLEDGKVFMEIARPMGKLDGESSSRFIQITPCEGNPGSAEFNTLRFGEQVCDSFKCPLKLAESYWGDLTFTPARNDSDLALIITSLALPPLTNASRNHLTLYTNFNCTQDVPYTLSYGVTFPYSQFLNRTGPYAIQLYVYSQKTKDKPLICLTHKVDLNAAGNNGSSFGEPCSYQKEPCAFENSLCLQNSTSSTYPRPSSCQCDEDYKYDVDKKGCKVTVDEDCKETKECISHSHCQLGPWGDDGECKCDDGYTYNSTAHFCRKNENGGSSALYVSIVGIAMLQLSVFVGNKILL